MRIVKLKPEDEAVIRQIAQILIDAFADFSPAWTTLEEAVAEIHESFGADRLSRVALSDEGDALGWIGGIEQYDGNVWELHPLAVSPAHQEQGVGKALVADLEEQVRQRGAYTLWLGTDDEDNRTTLADTNLYPDPLDHLSRIQNPGRHPYEFYQKQGFAIIGVMPDANGPGKPDIFMAKRIR